MTVVSEIAQPQTKKLSFALNRLAANLGMSLGPAIGGFIATHSYEMIFVVDSLTTLIAALILVFYPFRKRAQRLLAQAANPMPPVGSPSRRALTDIPFLFFLLGMFLLMSVYFQHESTLSIFMVKDLNLSPRDYGFVFTINTLLIVAFEVPLNSWTLRFSHRSAMFVGGVLYAIGFGILFWVNSFFGVAISVIIWSFGEMLESPAHSAFISDLAPRKRVGEYMGLLTCAYGLAFAVGPPVGAWILAAYSAKVLWVFCFIAALGGALILGYVKPPIKHGGSA